jgi:ribonuclease G
MQEIRIKVDTNEKVATLIEDYKIVERYIIKNQDNIEGNIYIGIIKNIVPGIKAAFVDIGKEKNAFIHFEDLYKINEEIKLNKKILVQVQKNPIKQKGAKLTANIKLTGRQIVLMPKTNFITISRKIEDEAQKQRLKELVEKYIPNGFGAIIRTSCISATEEEISQDIQRLVNRWNNIQKDMLENESDLPCLIEENNDIIKSLILGTADGNMNRIITNNEVFNKEIKNFLEVYNLDNNVKVDFEKDVFEKYTMQKELQDLENNKVWLRCGGYIVIDKTEALTAIDVNSGKCVGKDNLEDTILKVNTEAAKEIAKQLRLRDIGGIIIIDFIDMQEDINKTKLLNCFVEETKKDRAKVQVEGFSKLNLLELTRKQMYGKE